MNDKPTDNKPRTPPREEHHEQPPPTDTLDERMAEAAAATIRTLRGFPSDAQRRILRGVGELLGLNKDAAAKAQQRPAATPPNNQRSNNRG